MTNRKALALLLDPEKADLNVLPITSEVHPDYIFVGGSTGGDTTAFVRALKEYLTAQRSGSHLAAVWVTPGSGLTGEAGHDGRPPIILFPGNSSQFTPEADAVLFLSLLSGNNPEYLVNQQIKSARAIYDSQIDFVPTAYILIDGGVETSTMRVTGTKPLDPKDIDLIVDTCIAAELMGKTAIYLEAGSGALNPVSPEIIKSVREHTSVTLIVGGGIRTPEAMNAAYTAGADIVVIGNHFESHPEELKSFVDSCRLCYCLAGADHRPRT